jgi:hypothetical protein
MCRVVGQQLGLPLERLVFEQLLVELEQVEEIVSRRVRGSIKGQAGALRVAFPGMRVEDREDIRPRRAWNLEDSDDFRWTCDNRSGARA